MEGDLGRNWPNGFNLLEIQFPSRAGSVHFRQWSGRTRNWRIGTDIYRNAHDGIVRWAGEGSWLPTTPPVAVSANGNDALVLHEDGALALWRRGARAAPWWTRKARFFDVREPPLRVLAAEHSAFRSALEALADGDLQAVVSGEYPKIAVENDEVEKLAALGGTASLVSAYSMKTKTIWRVM
jgi:hypothetical protein